MGKISSSVIEISVTGPARLLICTHRNFCKEKSGEARSREPSQLGRLGSCEEAPSEERRNLHFTLCERRTYHSRFEW